MSITEYETSRGCRCQWIGWIPAGGASSRRVTDLPASERKTIP